MDRKTTFKQLQLCSNTKTCNKPIELPSTFEHSNKKKEHSAVGRSAVYCSRFHRANVIIDTLILLYLVLGRFVSSVVVFFFYLHYMRCISAINRFVVCGNNFSVWHDSHWESNSERKWEKDAGGNRRRGEGWREEKKETKSEKVVYCYASWRQNPIDIRRFSQHTLKVIQIDFQLYQLWMAIEDHGRKNWISISM